VKMEINAVMDTLTHDANQLDHHARKLRKVSPDLEAEAEEVDDRIKSIRKQIEILEQWE
jgi:predicted  nucleic acid-binding Zn-ribbon protein